MKVLLLNGSLRRGSVNGAVLETVRALAPAQAVVYGAVAELPLFNPDDDHVPLPPAVTNLRETVAHADALLICTPEYAGALPAALKNLLEWTVGSAVMHQKPVGWVNTSVNPGGAAQAHASLRLVLEYVNARPVASACRNLPVPRSLVGADGLIHDPAVLEELQDILRALRTPSI